MEARPGSISNRQVSITGHAVDANDTNSDAIVSSSSIFLSFSFFFFTRHVLDSEATEATEEKIKILKFERGAYLIQHNKLNLIEILALRARTNR